MHNKAYRKLVKVVEEEGLSGNDLYQISCFFHRQYIDWLVKRNIIHYMDNKDAQKQTQEVEE